MWKRFYGPLGLFIMIIMELVALLDIPYANIWITPIGWYGYIFFFDWLIYKKEKKSPLMTNTKEFLFMFPASIVLWCIFEVHNLFCRNWEYIGLPENKLLTLFGFALSFATILPAIYETFRFLKSRNFFNIKIRPHAYAKPRIIAEIILGLFLIGITIFFPSKYTGPLVWPGYFFLFSALNYLVGAPSVLKERGSGGLSDTLNLLLAGYICGIVWEFLNYWAGAKWIYYVPYFPDTKIFEMPVIGFLGFGPFAMAFFEMYSFLRFVILVLFRNPK